ncbi:syntaxin-51-like [Chenopodium quinoa]|uniref:syntaxin-51-like n=1 Tax=Chenopodium quinoa TaxID=63459 RepID=UPI000B780E94|nr:syntaxin-51-like [Chenopodium quinoa]XP_021745622.1 syntaxin-51-like [Chenopodium quinoa]XP_021745623.1 syntaxin-51-like [Chenopodium quinoa]
MASLSESWMREYNEASKLADEINSMVSEASTLPPTGTQTQRHFSGTRRKITILNTKLENLESLLAKLPSMQPITAKEMNKRNDLLSNLKSKINQMANTLNSYSAAYRDRLLGPDVKSDDVMKRASNMDNHGIVGFQRQIMREQDEGLEKLEETIVSTKHIALAVNEELTLHTRLLDTLDDHVESTNSRLQRIQRRLAIFNKRTKGGCACLCLLVVLIVALILVVLALIKYL